jgi:hypothetical protein
MQFVSSLFALPKLGLLWFMSDEEKNFAFGQLTLLTVQNSSAM